MRGSILGYAVGTIAVSALLSACSGSQAPAGAPPIPQARTVGSNAGRGASWMLPEAKGEKLLYVSSYYRYVDVYSYPKGRLVGKLTGFGILAADCSDKAGNVWIIDNQNAMLYEYAHGGTTPIATIAPPSSDPLSCAVNPRNGDLVVGTGTEQLLLYPHATGTPKTYMDYPIEGFTYCAYDPKGNLYISGLTGNYHFQFAELPMGAGSIGNLTLDQSIEFPGGLTAMANEVVVGDHAVGTIYEFRISGEGGTKIGTTPLAGAYNVLGPFTIVGGRVIAAIQSEDFPAVDVFDFPAGGAPVRSITKGVDEPLGVALSAAPPQ